MKLLPDYAAQNRAIRLASEPPPIDFGVGQVEALRLLAQFAWRVHTWANRMAYKIERDAQALKPNRMPRLQNVRVNRV